MRAVLSKTLTLLAWLASVSMAAAADLPATQAAWLAQMLDGKRNGAAFKDPAAFAEWLDTITDPRFMTALASTAVDPATYPKTLAEAMDPATARNWSEFTDPQLYLRWMLASASPSLQLAIVRKMSDPTKLKRWVDSASRPETYAPMLARFAEAPSAWMRVPNTPAYARVMGKARDPATPMAWFGAMMAGAGQPAGAPNWRRLPEATAGSAPRYRY